VIVTDGGLRADGSWQRLGYLPYALLHRTWQTHVLEMIATPLAGDGGAQALLTEMPQRYPKGFVAHLQGNVLPRMQQLTGENGEVCGQSAFSRCHGLSPMIGSRGPSGSGIVITSVRVRRPLRP
jgi:hypothetical protein